MVSGQSGEIAFSNSAVRSLKSPRASTIVANLALFNSITFCLICGTASNDFLSWSISLPEQESKPTLPTNLSKS